MTTHTKLRALIVVGVSLFVSAEFLSLAIAQQSPVTLTVRLTQAASARKQSADSDDSNIAVWLVPVDDSGAERPARPSSHPSVNPKLIQRNKAFEPHLLVIPVGTVVQFPNEDPFFHNVFSLYNGKRFDLGLYEAGSSKNVHFDRPGVSILFCNIHPEMSAVVIAVNTPYYATSDNLGRITIPAVPDGRYALHVWSERATADALKQAQTIVTISSSERDLAAIRIPENPQFTFAHKNKYGQDYVPPSNVGYSPQ